MHRQEKTIGDWVKALRAGCWFLLPNHMERLGHALARSMPAKQAGFESAAVVRKSTIVRGWFCCYAIVFRNFGPSKVYLRPYLRKYGLADTIGVT